MDEDIREEDEHPRTIRDKMRFLESKLDKMEKSKITEDTKKTFKFPFKWKWKFNQAKSKTKQDLLLMIFFNKKNEIETPIFVPVFSGNMIVYKDKAYEFDPRGIWRMRGIKNNPQVYCIREIDRKPIKNPDGTYKMYKGMKIYDKDAAISNMDIDEVRERGDSTESDEFLIKAALQAQTAKLPVNTNWIVGGIIIVVIVGVLIWLFTKGP